MIICALTMVNLDIYSIKVNIDPRPFKQSSVLYNMTHDVKKEKPLTKSDIYDNLQHQFWEKYYLSTKW